LSSPQSSKMPNLGLGSNPFRNSNQGSGSGSSSHPPVTIRRPIDESSTQFFQALNNNEVLGSVTIQFQGAGGLGYALDLTNAVIMSIERVMDAAVQGPCEDVEFAYSAKRIRLIKNDLRV
jgi:type VI secretion system Hcp family effector